MARPEEGFVTAKEPWGVEWMRTNKISECPICGEEVNTEKILFPSFNALDGKLVWEHMAKHGIGEVATSKNKEV